MNYTVNISLPKTLAELGKQQVKKGYYTSLSEVIRAALRQFLLAKTEVPTYKMSEKAEKRALKALKDYKEGKTIRLKNINDLDKYL